MTFLYCCSKSTHSNDLARDPIVSVRADERIFTVFAAIKAAGFEKETRMKEIEDLPIQAVQNVSDFIRSRGFSEQDYCAYALLLSDPPRFEKVFSTLDLKSPVRSPISDFNLVLREFYKAADIHSIWEKMKPEYEKEIKRDQKFANNSLISVFNFLKRPLPHGADSIMLFPNLLQKRGSGYGNLLEGVAYLIVGASADAETIQHEFLHTIINPLTRKHITQAYKAKKLHSLGRIRAPFYYRSWETMVNETLIRTIVAMLQYQDKGKRENATARLSRDGFLLAPYFLGKLESYEKGDIRFDEFYPRLFDHEDLFKETQRIMNEDGGRLSDLGKLSGPINHAVSPRFASIRVYGTHGSTRNENECVKAMVFNSVEYFNRLDAIKADDEITENDINTHNLILYGTVLSNSILKKIADHLPIKITSDAIIINERKHRDPRTKLIMACPNPLNPNRYAVIYGGLSWETIIDIHFPFHGPTDYVIYQGLNLREQGFFDKSDIKNWKISAKSEVSPEDKNWKIYQSRHYEFCFRPNSTAEKEIKFIAAIQEANYEKALTQIGASQAIKIICYLYDSYEDKTRSTGHAGSGIAVPALREIHLIYGGDQKVLGCHEDVHVMTYNLWGESPIRFLTEGIAVYSEGRWLSCPIDEWAYLILGKSHEDAINGLLYNHVFEDYPDVFSYPLAGSFVKYFVENFGMEKFKTFFISSGTSDYEEKFLKITDTNLDEAIKSWLLKIRSLPRISSFFGMTAIEINGRVVVSRIYSKSPADRAGIEVGDVIEKVNSVSVKNLKQFYESLSIIAPNDEVILSIVRRGNALRIAIRSESMDDQLRKW